MPVHLWVLVLNCFSLLDAPIARVREDVGLLSMQQLVRLCDVVRVRSRGGHSVNQARVSVPPDVSPLGLALEFSCAQAHLLHVDTASHLAATAGIFQSFPKFSEIKVTSLESEHVHRKKQATASDGRENMERKTLFPSRHNGILSVGT